MARKKQNPGSSEIIWIAALAGAAYLAYEYFLVPNASASTVAAAAAPAATGTPTSSPAAAPVVTPALGSTITSVGQAALQSAANYPYIVPDSATNSSLQNTGLTGYTMIITNDAGPVWARNDVYQAVQAAIQALITRATSSYTASGTTVPTAVYQNASAVNLNGQGSNSITAVMSAAGLHGLGLMGLYPLYSQMGWN